MGKKFAPAYANIYMADWEHTVFPKCPKLPSLYVRYLDDIFGIWTHTEEDFKEFINILNAHHAAIKVKFNLQTEEIEFLDTQVFIKKVNDELWGLGTRVYFKPTDTHALLHKKSFHPRHTFRGIVKSQLIRFWRICSEPKDVENSTRILFEALRKRGYSRTFLRNIKTEVRLLFKEKQVAQVAEPNNNMVPLVTTFSTASPHFSALIKRNFKNLQDACPSLANFRIISAFRKNNNLKDFLVHATLRNDKPQQRKVVHFKSIKYVKNIYTGTEKPVWQTFQPESTNLVYLIQCKVCEKLYVGQTQNRLTERLYQHLYHIDQNKKHTMLYEHFRDHGRENLIISGLETGVNWSAAQRWATERKWIKHLKTIVPNGLNEIEH